MDAIIPEITAAAKDVAAKPTEKKPLERLEKAKQAADDVFIVSHRSSNEDTNYKPRYYTMLLIWEPSCLLMLVSKMMTSPG